MRKGRYGRCCLTVGIRLFLTYALHAPSCGLERCSIGKFCCMCSNLLGRPGEPRCIVALGKSKLLHSFFGLHGTQSASQTVTLGGIVPCAKYAPTICFVQVEGAENIAQWPTESCTTTDEPGWSADMANALRSGVTGSRRLDRNRTGFRLACVCEASLWDFPVSLPYGPVKRSLDRIRHWVQVRPNCAQYGPKVGESSSSARTYCCTRLGGMDESSSPSLQI